MLFFRNCVRNAEVLRIGIRPFCKPCSAPGGIERNSESEKKSLENEENVASRGVVHYNPENKCVYQAYIHRIHASSDCASGLAKQLHQNVWQRLREEGYEIKKAYVQAPIEGIKERSRGGTPMIKFLHELGFVACELTDEDRSKTPLFKQSDYVKVL